MKIDVTAREADSITRNIEEVEMEIRSKAYEKFVARGETHGFELQDWLDAEKEVTANAPLQLTESNGAFRAVVHALGSEVPEVMFSERIILVRGKHSKGLFRHFQLSAPIDPSTLRVHFNDKEELHISGTLIAEKAPAHQRAIAS